MEDYFSEFKYLDYEGKQEQRAVVVPELRHNIIRVNYTIGYQRGTGNEPQIRRATEDKAGFKKK